MKTRNDWLLTMRKRLIDHLRNRNRFRVDLWRARCRIDQPDHPNWWGIVVASVMRERGWKIHHDRRSTMPGVRNRRIIVWAK